MFCPRANLVLNSTTPDNAGERVNIAVTASAGAPTSFPNSTSALDPGSEPAATISLNLVDCSTRDFHCKLVTLHDAEAKQQEFLLVLPREIRPGREYNFRGVRMVTRLSNYSSPRNVTAAQVTLWQRIGDEEMPMELTIQPGRGVLYWDGIHFAPGKGGVGEMCVLTSESGLFRGTGVRLH